MENELTVPECLALLQQQIAGLQKFEKIERVIDGRYYPTEGDFAGYGWPIQSEIEHYETVIKYMRLLIEVSKNVVDVSEKAA